MKPTIVITLSLAFIYLSPVHAQLDKQSLTGTWQLESQTDNSPFSAMDGITLAPPPRTGSEPPPPPPEYEPFQQKWAFDGTNAYVQQFSDVVLVTTYEVDAGQLKLNFKHTNQYELIRCSNDSLILSQEAVFGSRYTDTLYFKRINAALPDFAKHQGYAQRETLADFQLYGVYQHVLDRDKMVDLSSHLEDDELFALNLRIYPDSTLVFVPSVFSKEATGAARCQECNKLDVDFFPFPFGEYALQKEGDTFYFQPDYAMVNDGVFSQAEPIEEADQVRYEMIWNDGKLTLKGFHLPGLTTSSGQEFTFVPFQMMNYYFEAY